MCILSTALDGLKQGRFIAIAPEGRESVTGFLADRRDAIRKGTQQIMSILANQLPPEYRGVYGKEVSEQRNDL